MFDPIATHRVALLRSFRRFAMHLGMSESMSGVVAEAFMASDFTSSHWSDWMVNNCSTCSQKLGECSMLSPPEDQIPGSLTPEEFVSGQIIVIEQGRVTVCPRLS